MKMTTFNGFTLGRLLVLVSLSSGSATIFADELPSSTGCAAKEQSEIDAPEKKIKIDDIAVHIHPIFDENNPEENNWIFRTVNALHIDTRENTIKDDLLFEEGKKADGKLFDESERRLRTRSYLSSASVEPTNPCGESTNVNVDVHEVWTLVPEITYSHSGGNDNSSFGLHDSNFLGYGKTINITHTSSAERDGNLIEYIDPNTGISNTMFSFLYADNSDGVQKNVQFIKPFASLTTDWTAGIIYKNFTQEDTLYDIGKEVDRFAHDGDNESVFYGRKLDFGARNSVHRLLVGYTKVEDTFSSIIKDDKPSVFVPGNRQYNYPWIEYQHIDDKYIKAENIQQINRVEDINLGSEIRIRLGHASSDFAQYDSAYVLDSEFTQAFSLASNQLILTDITADGLYRDGEFFGGKVQGTASYHWQNFRRGQFFIEVTAGRGFHLFKDTPLELGGDTGLRGYPARYQAGDHLQLFSVEQRFFGEKEWFSLFHVGAAVFYDEGRVWGESAIPQSQQGWLRDVGVGLRISGTRTGNRDEGTHNVVHIDVASPLDGDKDISKVQWLVRVKKKF